jgi:hypothetical protein
MKTFFGVSVGIFCILLIFWGVYNFGFKNNPNIATVSEPGTIIKESSPLSIFTASTHISPVLQERVLSATTDGRSLLFYSLDKQAFQRSTLDGKERETLLSDLPGSTDAHCVVTLERRRRWPNSSLPDGSFAYGITADLDTQDSFPSEVRDVAGGLGQYG